MNRSTSPIQHVHSLLLLILAVLIPFSGFPLHSLKHDPPLAISLVVANIMIPGREVTDPKGNVLSVVIPLRQAGRLMLLEAVIDGKTGNFILDTGSSDLVLNQTYFRNYVPMDEVEGGGVTGMASPGYRVRVKHLELGGMNYDNLYADVTNLGHLENRRNVQIYGLIGMNLLKSMEIVIDVRRNELQLHRLDKEGNRLQSPSERPVFDIKAKVEESSNIAIVSVRIADKTLYFCLDTGAESNVLDLNLSKKVLGSVTIIRRSTLGGVGSARKEVLYGTMNDFVFGGTSMKKMPVILTNLSGMSQKYGFTINGMLGYDFFDTGIISINLPRQELGIVFNQEGIP